MPVDGGVVPPAATRPNVTVGPMGITADAGGAARPGPGTSTV